MSSKRNDPDPSAWERLEEALQRAIDCPPQTVGAVLAEVSAQDAALGRELEQLLEASRRLSFLDTPALSAGSSALGPAREVAGFKIEHEIGRGGMGAVYYATRATRRPYEAAVKFLVPPGGGRSWDSRFRREREILSRLEHPNIARLLDGGQTPVPFLVIEYVDGSRINRYCDRHELSIERRLQLFLEICDAVHYAHQNLVIHCDIKPANILVDTAGVPRLLDFGIAKLLDGAGGPSIDATRTSPRPLTPDYASPEQIEGSTPTTASDVYSLGVVLYEILCADVPYHLGGRSPQEIRALLESDDPALPSAVVESMSAGNGSREPVRCGLSSTALVRRLQGDLDLIAKMALRFDPRYRYASAAELARDVKRHLEGLPIQARPKSLRYTAQKLVRRHKLASAVFVLILTSVLAFGSAMAWQNARITRAQNRAERAFGASKAVAEFLVGLFEEAEEIEMSNHAMTAGELVDRGAERLGDTLRDQPMTRAAVENALGRLYVNLGRYEEARRHLESALSIRRSLGETTLVATTLEHVGRLHRIEGRFDEARRALSESLALSEAEPDQPGVLASTLFELARVEGELGSHEAAERLFERSLALRRSAFGERSLEVADSLHGLSQHYRELSRYDRAERLLRSVMEIQSDRLGPNHILIGSTANTLGRIYRSQGKYDKAEAALKRAVSIYESLRGPDHILVTAPKTNLAIVYGSIGEYDRASELFEQILAIRRATFGEPNVSVASSLFNLATVTDLQGDRGRAIEIYREAADAYEAVLGPENGGLGATLYNLSTLYLVNGELDLAEDHVRRSLEIIRKRFAPDHDLIAERTGTLGDIAYFRGDLESARALVGEAITIYEKASQTHPSLPFCFRRMGLIELDQENLAAARPWLKRALEIRQEALPAFHEERLTSQLDWADWLVASSREAEAEQLLRDLLTSSIGAEERSRSKSVFVDRIAAANLRLGRLLRQRGQPSEARQRLETAEAQLRSIASRTVEAERDLSLTLAALGHHQEASKLAIGLFDRGVRDRRLEPLLVAAPPK